MLELKCNLCRELFYSEKHSLYCPICKQKLIEKKEYDMIIWGKPKNYHKHIQHTNGEDIYCFGIKSLGVSPVFIYFGESKTPRSRIQYISKTLPFRIKTLFIISSKHHTKPKLFFKQSFTSFEVQNGWFLYYPLRKELKKIIESL